MDDLDKKHDKPDHGVSDSSAIEISQEILDKFHTFIALSNNHLMNIPVSGDLILESAKVMNMAAELNKIILELKAK